MYRFFINQEQLSDGFVTVSGEDAHHMQHVLRMRPGEAVETVDEEGLLYHCRIAEFTAEEAILSVEEISASENELPCRITLYMGLPKFDRMELIVQKAVELGAARIVPVAMQRSVVKLDEKKAAARRKRWQAIADAAAKQSKRGLIPEVGSVVSFKEALAGAKAMDHILFPYECAEGIGNSRRALASIKAGETLALFIGPEGGFGLSEVEAAREAGAEVLTLGRRILRTETAAIAAMSILMFTLEA
ncbi:MAG: 16S rRNA (uracil(1498)-N(3))-methyltransferase [Lachnospiraceae bacterium]|nr:16S rRNA (uracil(1498)-N(3))-methyltransferase [Lachnospiraceae bacterium]